MILTTRTFTFLLVLSLAAIGCGGASEDVIDSGADTESHEDTGTDLDGDTDSDIDADTDVDSDSDSDDGSNDDKYQWHTFLGGLAYDVGNSIAVGNDEGVYVTGSSSVAWNGPDGEPALNPYPKPPNVDGNSMFVVRLDSNGFYQWHTFFGSDFKTSGQSLAVDSSGALFVTGDSVRSWDGPNGEKPLNYYSAGDQYLYSDIYVLNLDSAGGYVWHTFFGSVNTETAHSVIVDWVGNILIAGMSSETWNGPDGESPLNPHSDGIGDITVIKLDSHGKYIWHTFHGDAQIDRARAIVSDGQGNYFVTGNSSSEWLGPDGQSPLNKFDGSDDVFVLKLDSNGSFLWHTYYGSSDADTAYSLDSTESGDLVVVGSSITSWDGPNNSKPLNSIDGEINVFVLKLDNGGLYQWHTFYGAPQRFSNATSGGDVDDVGTSIGTDANDNIFVTGQSYDPWSGPEGQAPLNTHSGADCQDVFVLKLDTDGTYIWHTFYGSPWTMEGLPDYGLSVAPTDTGSVFIAGVAYDAWEGPNNKQPLNPFAARSDAFVLKLNHSL